MTLETFWRARTRRERTIVQAAAVLVFAILLPVWCYLMAAKFREDSASELRGAERVQSQVARLAELRKNQPEGFAGTDQAIRERILASAEAGGLAILRLENAGADRVRVAFEPAESSAVYRWVEAISRRGGLVQSSAVVRVGDSDQVNAEFEVADSP